MIRVFKVEGTNGVGCFNYKNMEQVVNFRRELDSSSEVKKIGVYDLPCDLFSQHKAMVYNLNGSNLVLEFTDFPIPDLTIDGKDEEHLNKTLEILTRNHPQVKISNKEIIIK